MYIFNLQGNFRNDIKIYIYLDITVVYLFSNSVTQYSKSKCNIFERHFRNIFSNSVTQFIQKVNAIYFILPKQHIKIYFYNIQTE